MERIVGAGAGYLKSLLSSRKATSGDNREVGSGLSGNYEHTQGLVAVDSIEIRYP